MNLTHNEILEIIGACKGSVKSLKISSDNLEVIFIEPHQPVERPPTTHNQGSVTIPIEIADDKNIVKDLKQPVPREEEQEQELIDELALTNPSAFEDLIALGEVARAKEENN